MIEPPTASDVPPLPHLTGEHPETIYQAAQASKRSLLPYVLGTLLGFAFVFGTVLMLFSPVGLYPGRLILAAVCLLVGGGLIAMSILGFVQTIKSEQTKPGE